MPYDRDYDAEMAFRRWHGRSPTRGEVGAGIRFVEHGPMTFARAAQDAAVSALLADTAPLPCVMPDLMRAAAHGGVCAVLVDADGHVELAGCWETAENCAATSVRRVAVADDGDAWPRERIQTMMDQVRAWHVDCFGVGA